MRESKVEARCRKDAEADGWTQIKVLKRSWPDRMFFRAGGPERVWVEFKAPDKEPRRQQELRIGRMKDAGEAVLVVDTSLGFVARLNDATRGSTT